MSKLQYFLSASEHTVLVESSTLEKLHSAAVHDCHWLIDLQLRLCTSLQTSILPELHRLQGTLYTELHLQLHTFQQFLQRSSDDDLQQEIDFAKNMGELSIQILLTNLAAKPSDEYAQWMTTANIMRDRLVDFGILAVLKTQAYRLNATLFTLERTLFQEVLQVIMGIEDFEVYQLDESKIRQFYGELPLDFMTGKSVVKVLKNKLLQYLENDVFLQLSGMRETIADIYVTKLDEIVTKTKTRQPIELPFNLEEINRLISISQTIQETLESFAIKSVTTSLNFISELRRSFALLCENELERVMHSYRDASQQTQSVISEMQQHLTNFHSIFTEQSLDYKASKLSLERFAEIEQFVELQGYLKSKQLVAGSQVQNHKSRVQEVHRQLDNLYSRITAQVNITHLKTHSTYYSFEPEPRSEEETTVTLKFRSSDINTNTNSDVHSQLWNAFGTRMDTMKENQASHADNVIDQAQEAHHYLQEFSDGNRINENFFK